MTLKVSLPASAHPMLEPLDYELDPEQARAHYGGDLLTVYEWLWKAGVATICEGPVVRLHALEARLGVLSDYPWQPVAYGWEVIERGWGDLLPGELSAVLRERFPVYRQRHAEMLVPWVPPYLVSTLRGGQRAAGIEQDLRLEPPSTWKLDVVKWAPAPMDLARLVADMATQGVGRPSTFASRLHAAIDHDLIRKSRTSEGAAASLEVGQYGQDILERLARIPEESRIDAAFSTDLEQALTLIEEQPEQAGRMLNEFCHQALGFETELGQWLDAVLIEGESLTEALERRRRALPPVTGWREAAVPAGLNPPLLAADANLAVELRGRVDAGLADLAPNAWRAHTPRQRAVLRLAALACWTPEGGDHWLKEGVRNVVVRWWIDLDPEAAPFSAIEWRRASEYLASALSPNDPDWAELIAGVRQAL